MKRVAIIGGGLAGTSLAFSCMRNGLYPIIFERELDLACAASGNFLGLVNPRPAADMNAQSLYFSIGFQMAVELFDDIAREERGGQNDIGWNKCGALHLITDDKRSVRFTKMVNSWGWNDSAMTLLSKRNVSQQAGILLDYEALFLADSGSVCPPALCNYYAQDADRRYGVRIEESMIGDLDVDVVVLANAQGAQDFSLARSIPFGTVRGQITKVSASAASARLRCNLHYGGYISPAQDGVRDAEQGSAHVIGATFQRWLDHGDAVAQDDADNLAALAAIATPDFTDGMRVLDHRAALRCTVRDHFPVVGKLGRIAGKDVYISAAHGSHGLVSSRIAAEIIVGQISGRDVGVPQDTLRAVSPQRFL